MTTISIRVQKTERYVCFAFTGDLIDDHIEELIVTVRENTYNFTQDLLFDFDNVNTLSSRAVTVLVRMYKSLSVHKRRLGLINVSNELKEMLDSINLTRLIPIFGLADEFVVWLDSEKESAYICKEVKVRVERTGAQDGIAIVSLNPVTNEPGDFKTDQIADNITEKKIIIQMPNINKLEYDDIFAIFQFAQSVNEKGGKVILVQPKGNMMDILNLFKSGDEFMVCKTFEEALTALQAIA